MQIVLELLFLRAYISILVAGAIIVNDLATCHRAGTSLLADNRWLSSISAKTIVFNLFDLETYERRQ
jgi:hypothetical protein